MEVVAGDDDVEAYDFRVDRVLQKTLWVVLFLRRPVPQPKLGNQPDRPF